ncbi:MULTISPECIES: phenylacetate--CoA ligase family protein [Aequorivita]|uniref:Phenylacetate--CoA ligase family protein n=2 Tax=Aequorivita TaxID=153265 RepID=A0AB35YS36_9FLAO|nr:phenylacetate--CoA ligase family protein [Aequorivita sp. Ant34-E75]WGF93570.1 phenylacetate--CoA ligase family protein [Aequorivita sp. Ant34-E75]
MNLFEFTLKFSGFPIAEAKRKLKNIQQIPENEFENYVLRAREEIVKYHLQNTPFYKNFIGKNNVAWKEIPVLTKSHLQQPLELRLSTEYQKNSIYISKTSGSSGTPFIFAKDKYCHALAWAKFLSSYGKLEIDLNTSLQARFYGIPLELKGYYKERFKDFLGKRYRFPIFNLSDEKLKGILNSFKKKEFVYMNGYTSSIVLFAKYIKEQKVVLKHICPTLKYCIVTSEMLFEDDKRLMERVFGVPVINEYGASELGMIAFTDKQDNLIGNSEDLFIEILDDNNNAVPLGQTGRIIVTSLYNKAHPMIRYEIGDSGALSTCSTLKRPVLEKLIGRTNDFAKLPSGKVVPGLTFYYVTKTIISNSGNVKEFVIEQSKTNTFNIQYVANRALEPQEKLDIEKSVAKYLETDLKLIFEKMPVLERSKNGKLKQFTSLVEME